jgi:hypothetical protein
VRDYGICTLIESTAKITQLSVAISLVPSRRSTRQICFDEGVSLHEISSSIGYFRGKLSSNIRSVTQLPASRPRLLHQNL